jgi:glycosyltransferase involved in cell wall biosynthesis
VSGSRHVVLNALFLAPGVSGGPETYLRGLAPALAEERPNWRFTIATTRSGAARLRADGWEDTFAVRAFPCEDGQRARRTLAEQVLLPAFARRSRADLVHSLASVAPIRTPGVRSAITLHDVTFFHEETFARVTTLGMRAIVGGAARRADVLITGTAAARDSICATLGLPPERFTVAHHGIDHRERVAPAPAETVRARYELEGRRLVLCVAAKRPHKNQALLVRAAALLEDDVVIVLAGHPEPYDAELRALARELGVESRIRFADYVPPSELEALWALAGCAAFPTRAEGFGIPVVEALARGLPVVCSDIPVLREVGGDTPRYFDPASPEDAARAIRDALARGVDADAARAWAGRFTWAASAARTIEAYGLT